MTEFKQSVKYEVVIGFPEWLYYRDGQNPFIGNKMHLLYDKWQEYAKEFYDKNNVYVSAIAVEGRAVYHKDWGCPDSGEPVMIYHCTANPEFIKDLDMYEKGILYITKKMKKEFKQHTITITKIPSRICYLTDEDNLEE